MAQRVARVDTRAAAHCDVLVVGGMNTDYIARGRTLPRGDSQPGDRFVECCGGKGVNQAVVAARLGARVVLVGAAGSDDRARHLRAHLRDERVDDAYVITIPGEVTGAAVVHVDQQGSKQSLAVLAANNGLTRAHVANACSAIGDARVILAQFEVPLESIVCALEWGRSVGARTIVDPAPPRALSDAMLSLIDVIKPNAQEAEALTGITVTDRVSARHAAERLLARGAGAVIIEAADEGTLVLSAHHERLLPPLPARVVDTTGAGDSFAGALAAFLAAGEDLLGAAKLANAAAAIEITSLGPQTPAITETRVRQLLEQYDSP